MERSAVVKTYDAVETAVFVALRTASRVFRFPGAELPEVLRSTRDDICEELHLDTAERLT
jgi:hypothetical protein